MVRGKWEELEELGSFEGRGELVVSFIVRMMDGREKGGKTIGWGRKEWGQDYRIFGVAYRWECNFK